MIPDEQEIGDINQQQEALGIAKDNAPWHCKECEELWYDREFGDPICQIISDVPEKDSSECPLEKELF